MRRIFSISAVMFCSVLVAATAFAQQPSSKPDVSEVVWTWSKQCKGDHKLGVKIHLYHKVLYRGVLAICPGSRDGEDGRAEFHFSGGHTFQGRYHTLAKDSIEGDIWQASADPDALILGISFATSKQILLNTLHVASPEKQTSSVIDKDIFITTYPVPAR